MSKELSEVLQGVVDRSNAQKAIRFAAMRDELRGLGYSIVTTVWLDGMLDEIAAMKREAK